MILELHNVWCDVRDGTDDELILLDRLTTAVRVAKNPWAARKKWWAQDQAEHYFDHRRGRMPTGLVPAVLRKWVGSPPQVSDLREVPRPAGGEFMPLLREQRESQISIIYDAIHARGGVVNAATGSGKTEIMLALAKYYSLRTVVAMPSDASLLRQTADRFRAVFPGEVGQCGGGKADHRKRITVAMAGALVAADSEQGVDPHAMQCLKTAQLLFVDEAHHTRAPGLYRLCTLCEARYRYAMSATLVTVGDPVLEMRAQALFGDVIQVYRLLDAVREGVVAVPVVIQLPTVIRRHKTGDRPQVLDMAYKAAYARKISGNTDRNQDIVAAVGKLWETRRRTLVIVKELAHGEQLRTMLADAGLECPWVSGSTKVDERIKHQRRLAAGTIPALVASTIFDEGKDVPEIDAVVLGVGEYSPIGLLQRIGRGSRRKAHNFLVVVDFEDHGRFVHGHTRTRLATLRREGLLVVQGWPWLENLEYTEKCALNHYFGGEDGNSSQGRAAGEVPV